MNLSSYFLNLTPNFLNLSTYTNKQPFKHLSLRAVFIIITMYFMGLTNVKSLLTFLLEGFV